MSLFRSQRRRTTEGRIPDRRLNGTAGKSITSDFHACVWQQWLFSRSRCCWLYKASLKKVHRARLLCHPGAATRRCSSWTKSPKIRAEGKGWTRLLWQPPDRKRLHEMLTRLEILKCLRAFAFGRKTGAKKKNVHRYCGHRCAFIQNSRRLFCCLAYHNTRN